MKEDYRRSLCGVIVTSNLVSIKHNTVAYFWKCVFLHTLCFKSEGFSLNLLIKHVIVLLFAFSLWAQILLPVDDPLQNGLFSQPGKTPPFSK